jgi:aminoglycoside 6-adenylyltransferase
MSSQITGHYAAIINRLLALAHDAPDIKAVIVIGSQARSEHPADEYSDLDLFMLVDDPDVFLSSSGWLEQIGHYWMWFTEDTIGGAKERRVLFENALDVDFLLFTEAQFRRALHDGELQALFARGHLVLLDEVKIATCLPIQPTPHLDDAPPSQAEFSNLINDFWYHTVWSAKKLRRGEIWVATSCLNGYMRSHLLKLIEWHAHVTHGWNYDTWHSGRFLEQWADNKIVQALHGTFAHYDPADVKQALLATMSLFRSLALEVASALDLTYPSQADDEASNWVRESLTELHQNDQPKEG